MTERAKGRHTQGYRYTRTLFSLILAVITLGCALCACSSSPQAPATADITEDPALSNDPAIAAELEEKNASLQWLWRDGEQRWRYAGDPATAPRVAMDAWIFEPGAVQLRVIAPAQLNLYLERPHALVMRIILLADLKAFEERRATRFGLQDLLSLDSFDPSVLGVTQYSLMPGSDQMISLDRPQNARYIGIVTGYYGLDGKRSARLIPLPAFDDTPTTTHWLARLSFGFLEGTEALPPRPAKLKMLLRLGVDQIDELKIHAH